MLDIYTVVNLRNDLNEFYPELCNFIITEDHHRLKQEFLIETDYVNVTGDRNETYLKIFIFIRENEHMHSFWLL